MEKAWSFITSVPWLIVLGWLGSNFFTYWIGRRQSLDKIQLPKRHELAEQLAVALQEDYHARVHLRKTYVENFSHLPTIREGADAFDKFDTFHVRAKQMIADLPAGIAKLQQLNSTAAIYLRNKTVKCIQSYIENTNFTYTTFGEIIGPLDYTLRFFENLLDERNFADLTRLYHEAIRRLQRSTR